VSEKNGTMNSMCDMENVCSNPGEAFKEKGKAPKFPALFTKNTTNPKCMTYPNGMKIYCGMSWDGKKDKISAPCPPAVPSMKKAAKSGASSLQTAVTTMIGALLFACFAQH